MGCANMARAALQSPLKRAGPPAQCSPQGTHSSPFMPVLVGSGRAFIFYSQGISTPYVYPRQVCVSRPGVLMLLCCGGMLAGAGR